HAGGVVVAVAVVGHACACGVGFGLGGVAALQFAFVVGDGPRRVGTAVRVVLHCAVHGASFVFGRWDCGRSQRHDRSGGGLLVVFVLVPHGDDEAAAPGAAEAAGVAAGRVRGACFGQRR